MERSGLERTGYIRSHLSTGEERLCIPGRNDVQLTVVVELSHGVERTPGGRCSEGKRVLELIPLRLCRPSPRQETMGMLSRDAKLSGQIGDRQTFAPEQRLPDLGFIAHGLRS